MFDSTSYYRIVSMFVLPKKRHFINDINIPVLTAAMVLFYVLSNTKYLNKSIIT